jgi:PAS domain S-box-containing protein
MYRILYVDDESDLLEIGKIYLERSEEFAVDTSLSAKEVLKRDDLRQYDAIVSDFQMPGMDGIAFLKVVRSTFGDLPFILFTGKGREEIVIEAINNGADFYLQKGGDPTPQFAELMHDIRMAVKRNRAGKEVRESEERYRSLFLGTHLVALLIDPLTGMIVDANPSACTFYGYSFDQLTRMGIFDLNRLPKEKVIRSLQEAVHRPPDKSGKRFFSTHYLADGGRRFIEISTVIITVKNKTLIYSINYDITERRLAEQALRDSEKKYHEIFENMLEGFAYCRMLYDPDQHPVDFIYLDVNLAFYRIIGVPLVAGKRCTEVFPGIKEAFPELFETYGRVALTGIPESFDIDFRPIGKWLHIAVYSPEKEYFVAVFEDITGSKMAVLALHESEQKFRTIADFTYNWEIWEGPEHEIRYCSPSCERITGYTAGEFVQDPHLVDRIVHPDDQDRWNIYREGLHAGSLPQSIDYRIVRKDGGIRWIGHIGQSVVDGNGNYQGRRISNRDITRQQETSDELRAAYEQIAASEEELRHQLEEITERDRQLLVSEEKLRLKMDSILSPESDIGETEFANIINSREILPMMEDIYSLTHMTVAILDLKGNIVVAIGWQDICTKFHRVSEQSCRNCTASDLYLTQNVQPGEHILYKCKNHMWDMATPIIIGKKHMGNLYIGQFFFEGEVPDRAVFANQAEQFGFDKEEYLAALDRVPRRSHEDVNAIMDFYSKFISLVSSLGYSNLKLAKSLLDNQQAVNALAKSEEKFREYIGYSPEGIFVADSNGRYIDVNQAACDLTGYTREELLALDIARLVPPGNTPAEERWFRNILADGQIPPESLLLRKDGTVLPVVLNAVHLPSGQSIAFCSDMTERRRAEEALVASEKEFRLLAEAMPQIVWITRADGWTIFFNQHWVDYTGLTLEESYGHGWNKPFHPDDQKRAWDAWQNAVTNNVTYSLECRLRAANGTYRWWLIRGVPVMDEKGVILKWFGTCTDIEEIKKTEENLRQINRKLNLLSGITRHDIRNQLHSLKTYLDLSKNTLDDATKTREYILREEKAATTIERQIIFTKEYENLGIDAPVWQTITTCVKNSVAILPIMDIRIITEIDNLEVYADPLLEKVFYNIIDNALRYGGPKMTMIRIFPEDTSTGKIIVVENDGEGLSTDDKANLFERGYGRNTGLGLYLSREILSITGITIRENSEPGNGARFEMTVPEGRYRFSIK